MIPLDGTVTVANTVTSVEKSATLDLWTSNLCPGIPYPRKHTVPLVVEMQVKALVAWPLGRTVTLAVLVAVAPNAVAGIWKSADGRIIGSATRLEARDTADLETCTTRAVGARKSA